MFEDEKVVYCIDANILIQAWQKYYSPEICPSYWQVLNDLGKKGVIFIPELVYEEIEKGEDNLFEWLKSNGIHSKADPWVIAHAIKENAIVVTKETKDYFKKQTKIKIPHVCDNMNVKWIDDFEFIRDLNIKFTCKSE